MKEMEKKYNHKVVEQGKYDTWLKKGYFSSGDKSKEPFSIVLPPPNVTGKLHLGHAWDGTLQDIIIRRKRMMGYDALWLPGMDHAGIATQAKVDERLKSMNISRYDIGRDKFLEKSWEWKEEYASHIREQWGALGLSLDYNKERFTLDKGLNDVVNKVFIDLYNKGLIYRGERAINWDPVAKTALSNIEVEHKEVNGKMHYLKYYIEGTDKFIEVATTRLETLGSDKALVVHPNDERYKNLIGKKVITPLTKEAVPVITDDYIDMDFGSGAMKCSAHAAVDVDILMKHNLEIAECINPDGYLNELAGEFAGLERVESRKAILDKLTKEDLVIKSEDHMQQVGHSERTGALIETLVMPQWFVKMDELANNALKNQSTNNKVQFVPNRFENTFNTWMGNIHDWCISRQLWWGHRIPAWYKDEEVKVQLESPGEDWKQDEDVLDTWFSSALWPFSTLGWDSNSEDYKRYFPNNLLVTGYDIIFFWVSRMIFQSLEFTNNKPFDKVLIHGLIRDKEGRKMSKSLGNGVDPMDIKEKYGIDSLRYFLTTNSSPGQDLRFDEDKIESSWNFINKIWNISRYCKQNLEGFEYKDIILDTNKFTFADKYILSRLNETIKQVDVYYEKFDFGEASKLIYNFTWDDFASWYVELTKVTLSTDQDNNSTKSVLTYVLNSILKLLHPFMPFVTEEIYQNIPHEDESIMISSWPVYNKDYDFKDNLDKTNNFFELIKSIRNIRNESNCPISKELDIFITSSNKDALSFIDNNKDYLDKFVNFKGLILTDKLTTNKECISKISTVYAVNIPLEGLVNFEEELIKLEKEETKLQSEIKRAEGMLSNERFTSKAPKEKVDSEKEKLELYKEQLKTIQEQLKNTKAKIT